MSVIQTITLNQAGLAQVARHLKNKHRQGLFLCENTVTVQEYAKDVCRNIADDNGYYFEIESFNAISGFHEYCHIDQEGVVKS